MGAESASSNRLSAKLFKPDMRHRVRSGIPLARTATRKDPKANDLGLLRNRFGHLARANLQMESVNSAFRGSRLHT